MIRSNPSFAKAAGSAAVALVLAACSSGQKQTEAPTQQERSDVLGRLDGATQLIGEFRQQIPDDVANRAQCVVVLPGLKKGGVVVGGVGGKGFASCYSNGSWSPPAPLNVGGGTLGAQLGFQATDVIALMTSSRAVQALDSGNFKIGGSLNATAGPVGTGRGAAGDVTVTSDIVSYSKSSGLFAGATLDGTSVSYDDSAAMALYGSAPSMASILERNANVQEPPSAMRFRAALQSSFVPAAIGVR
jgi:lipid-binding SYLF domain-containing protein